MTSQIPREGDAEEQALNQIFEPEEPLYIRINPKYQPANIEGALLEHIVFPACSVNRGLYSKPIDVTLPNHRGWSVGGFKVGDVPPELHDTKTSRDFQFQCVHCPENGVWAHSEIRSYSKSWVEEKPTKSVRTTFREIIRDRMRIVVQATSFDQP